MAKFRLVQTEQPEKKQRFRVLDQPEQIQSNQISENLKEIVPQFAKQFASGAGGTYGDILDILGLQSREVLPGEQEKRKQEFQTLEKLQQPGYIPSVGELENLVDEDVLPRYSRLPSSQIIESTIEQVGGPEQPKTFGGKLASRAGKFAGAGTAFGTPGLVSSIAAGTAGQTAEELGAPPWVQAAAELGAFIKTAKPNVQVTSSSPEIKQQISNLRKMGFNEQDITLAKNALEDRGFLKKTAKITPESREKIYSTISNLEEKSKNIISDAFPGIEKGIQSVEEEASNLYQLMNETAENVQIRRGTPFIKAGEKVLKRLNKTLANTPEEKQMINLVAESIAAANGPLSADYYTRFYRGLNRLGKWVDPSEREQIFTEMKDAIKETFKESGREGQLLGKRFEDANKAWKRFREAEDVTNLLEKATTEEGLNYSKLTNILENLKNFESFKTGLGETEAKNLLQIAKTGKGIKNLEKAIEGSTAKQILGVGKLWSLVKAVTTGDLSALKSYVGAEALSRFSTKLLTDPSYQNINLRMLKNIKENKWGEVRSLANVLQKKVDSEGISEKKVSSNKP